MKKVEESGKKEERGRQRTRVVAWRRGRLRLTVEIREVEVYWNVVQPGGEPFRIPLGVDGDLEAKTIERKEVSFSFRRVESERIEAHFDDNLSESEESTEIGRPWRNIRTVQLVDREKG